MVRSESEWDSLYGNFGKQKSSCMTELPVESLIPWKSKSGEAQPFQAYSDQDRRNLEESIRVNGIMEPLLVRPAPGGMFQIIAGHHRLEAAVANGFRTVPVIIRDLDDFEALVIMTHTNTKKRSKILPSELVASHAQLITAVQQRHGIDPKSLDATDLGGVSLQEVADELGECLATVYRYYHISRLPSFFMPLLDTEAISLQTADSMSHLSGNALAILQSVMERENISKVTPKQVELLAKAEESEDVFSAILIAKKKPPRASALLKIKYEPKNVSPAVVKKLNKDAAFQSGLNDLIASYISDYIEKHHDSEVK